MEIGLHVIWQLSAATLHLVWWSFSPAFVAFHALYLGQWQNPMHCRSLNTLVYDNMYVRAAMYWIRTSCYFCRELIRHGIMSILSLLRKLKKTTNRTIGIFAWVEAQSTSLPLRDRYSLRHGTFSTEYVIFLSFGKLRAFPSRHSSNAALCIVEPALCPTASFGQRNCGTRNLSRRGNGLDRPEAGRPWTGDCGAKALQREAGSSSGQSNSALRISPHF